MFVIHPLDFELDNAAGEILLPINSRGVQYTLETKLAGGAMGVVYRAIRRSPRGESFVVIKLLRPQFIKENQEFAITSISKEASSLQLLNDQTPPISFVVRLLDFGFFEVSFLGNTLNLPWLALEYVQGGVLGTTLTQRIETSCRSTGYAFDRRRTSRVIEHICQGMTAVHEIGVIHRDLKPENVLCCGFDDNEIFKISDFGIARNQSSAVTFGSIPIGTIGYSPVEQLSGSIQQIGPWTDIFSIGAIVYFLLTGGPLFQADSIQGVLRQIALDPRKSIRESKLLDPELAGLKDRCDALDQIIARATALNPQERPRSARELRDLLLPHLLVEKNQSRSHPTTQSLQGSDNKTIQLSWSIRHAPGEDRVIRDVTWNSDGTALAVTSEGLEYWTGIDWRRVPLDKYPDPSGLHFVHKTAQDRWILGGTNATLAIFSTTGIENIIQGQDPQMVVEHVNGDLSDLALMVATVPNSPPLLLGMSAWRWLKAMPLEGIATITGIARIEEERWLITGRTRSRRGYAALYEPLQWELTPLAVPRTQAFLACSGLLGLNTGVAIGTDGWLLLHKEGWASSERIRGETYLSAVAISPTKQVWIGAGGNIYYRHLESQSSWIHTWKSENWTSPFISIQADAGVFRAISVDGGVLESHWDCTDPL